MAYNRDRNDAEVDLVIEHLDSVTLLEAKSAQTASSSLFSGARRVSHHLANSSRPCDLVVACGGNQSNYVRRGF